MQTATTTRTDIFKQGVKQATGTMTFWKKITMPDGKVRQWGTVTLDGPLEVEYFVGIEKFPRDEQPFVVDGCRVVFDAEPGQADMESMQLPVGTQRRKPKIAAVRLDNSCR